MKKKTWLLLLVCVLLIGLVAGLAHVIGGPNRQISGDIQNVETEETTNDVSNEILEHKGYVYIGVGDQEKWFFLPKEESTVTLRRTDENGKEICNEIAFTPDGVYMKSSTCENQDCVNQGLVTLENKATRVLQHMILCLPNDVIIELYSAEEILAMSGN